MSNIFFNIEPKVINTELACIIGLNEAIVLQQFHYWLERNKTTATNFQDGRYWTYGTIQEYTDRDFPFWSFDTVKRTVAKLIKLGFVIQGNYNKQRFDQTRWYTIDYAVVEEWIRKNIVKRDNSPLVHNALMEQGNLPQSKGVDCPNPSAQDASIQQGSMPHAIQENKKQINNKRLTNNTHIAEMPMATATAALDVVESAERLFDEFWKRYPRKENKQQAKRAWSKLNPDQVLFNVMANALEYRRHTKEWLAEGGRYIPHPATWLNGRRWEDEIDPQRVCSSAAMQEKYGGIRLDGKPLDPVQKKQLEYIEKQMHERQLFGEV